MSLELHVPIHQLIMPTLTQGFLGSLEFDKTPETTVIKRKLLHVP